MEKKLLLLGMLRHQDMHGYQLSEHLEENVALGFALKKSNAYKLLGKMEADGWITYRIEQVGNRPRRRVYTLTPSGEEAFLRLLREHLAAYVAPDFPSLVAMNFLQALPPEEAGMLLRQRRQQIAARFAEIEAFPEEVRSQHLPVDYLCHFFAQELQWLDGVIDRLDSD